MDRKWYHVCWPRLTAKRVEPVVSISWASCFYRQDALPVAQPTVSKHWREKYHIPWTCLPQAHIGVFQLCLWPLIAPGNLGGGLPCLSSALWCQYPLDASCFQIWYHICIIFPRMSYKFLSYLLLPAYDARLTYYTLLSNLCKEGFSMQVSI